MEVTYNMGRADLWRCNLYILFHRPATASLFLATPLLLAGLILTLIGKDSHELPSVETVLLTVALTGAAYGALQALVMYGLIQSKLPARDSQRVCTTAISPEGVRDRTPEQDQLIAWRDVKGIRINRGDVYFWKRSSGIIVPRGAFESREDADRYYQAALDFWRHRSAHGATSFTHGVGLNELGSNGETVSWRGNPDPKAQSRQTFRTAVVLTLGLMLPFSVIFFVAAGLEVWKAILGIWVFVLTMLSIPLLVEPAYVRKIQYSVTDKDLLCSVDPSLESRSSGAVELAQVECIKYWKLPDGVGSLEFSSSTASIKFDTIENAARVFALVAKARGRSSEGIETLFSGHPSTDPFLGILYPDERLVWQGQPNPSKYLKDFWGWKGGVVSYPIAAVLIILTKIVFSQPLPMPEQFAMLAPFMLLGGWLISLRHDVCARNAKLMHYAATDRRLLILKQFEPMFFAETDLAPVRTMNRMAVDPRRSSLSFGGVNAREFSFDHLDDPEEVRQIILGARQTIERA